MQPNYKEIINSLEFLNTLGIEMVMQDHDGQAAPRFWVVAENKKEYGYDDGYCDGTVVIDSDGEVFETPEELVTHLIECTEVLESLFEKDYDYGFREILELIPYDDYSIVNYRDMHDQIAPDTMFLTKQGCKNHIQLNHYHYKEPHTYAMTAWRSPQVEELFKILQNTNWEYIKTAIEEKIQRELDM